MNKTQRRLAFILLLGAAMLLTGCYSLVGGLYFDEDGQAEVLVAVLADEALGGEEARILAWQLNYLFPQLDLEYTQFNELTEGDYTLYHETIWISNEPVDISGSQYFSFTERDDGSFAFEAIIPPVLDDVTIENHDETILRFGVSMPKPIDIANTPTLVDENTAVWNITRGMLVSGTRLRVYTE
ncbi:MAG: hypothetical protein ACOYD6_02515 [Limnochordia bacterium]|jgi:hypothetical protein